MDKDLIKITPDKLKAKSMLKMAEITLNMIKGIDTAKYSSNVTKEYYEVIRELIAIILLLNGYKTYGEGAHKKLIEYIRINYKQLSDYEVSLIDDLRIIRNKIAYDGFFVEKDFIERKTKDILAIISKLKAIIQKEINYTHGQK